MGPKLQIDSAAMEFTPISEKQRKGGVRKGSPSAAFILFLQISVLRVGLQIFIVMKRHSAYAGGACAGDR